MFELNPQQILTRILIIAVWSISCIAFGYAWHYHRASVADAGREGTQNGIQAGSTAGAKAVDAVAITNLKSALKTSNDEAKRLRTALEETRRENPASADYRLPVGLRDQLNAQLNTSRP